VHVQSLAPVHEHGSRQQDDEAQNEVARHLLGTKLGTIMRPFFFLVSKDTAARFGPGNEQG